MKNKLAKILEDLNGGDVAKAKKSLRALLANFDEEVGRIFGSRGGAAGRGKAKRRSPEFYKILAAKGVAARQAKRAQESGGREPLTISRAAGCIK